MVNVPNIEFEFSFPRNRVSAVCLRPAGNAGTHVVAARLFPRIKRKIFGKQGARSDNRHIAFENVKKLRQFIERSLSHKAPDARQALAIRKQIAGGIALVRHCFKLNDTENFPVFPGAFLREKDACSLIREMQKNAKRRNHRRGANANDYGEAKINCALEKMFVHAFIVSQRLFTRKRKNAGNNPEISVFPRNDSGIFGTGFEAFRLVAFPQMPILNRNLYVLPALAGTLLLGGCISSKRMADISPLSESDEPKMSEKRVNAWPLYYATGAGGVSVLWPFLDFDDNGWAFRPFYVRDGDEHSALWPLSGWDPDGGWALTSYWNDEGFGAVPLFHWSKSERLIFPFWWESNWADWGVFPFVGIGSGDGDWRFLNFYYRNTDKYFHRGNACSYSHWNFWPFLLRKSYTEKGASEPHKIDWSLLYGLLGGYKKERDEKYAWLFPLFYDWGSTNREDYFTWVFPTFFRSNENGEFVNTLLPFYYYAGRGNDYAFITPLGWHSESGDSETTAVLPLYYYNTRGNGNYVFATPLGGWGKFSDGGHLRYALGPLYIDYASPEDDYTFNSVLWPLYMQSRRGKEESTYLFPFGHRWTNGNETRRGFLLGLGATRSRDDKTSWALWPLYGSRDDFSDADFRYFFTLAGSKQNASGDRSANWLFPLYHYVDNGKNDYEFYALSYLFGVENSFRDYNHSRKFENYFFPFYFYESWTKCDKNGVPVTNEPHSSEFDIPLIYGFDTQTHAGAQKKSRNDWALMYLFNFKENNYAAIPTMREHSAQALENFSRNRYINTFWETRNFRVWKNGALTPREQLIVRASERYCYDTDFRAAKLAFPRDKSQEKSHERIDLDKEIFAPGELRNIGWQEREKKYETFFHRELLKILRKKGIEPDGLVFDGFFERNAMTRAVQKLVAENTEIFTEKEFQVWPFYESTEASDGNFEKEFLWGVWSSRGNAESSKTSCLKYLYRRETTAAGTRLDVFPFTSIDSGKRGAFSFLGKFFKIVNDDETGWSGNFLFIPWGNSESR